MQCIVLAGDAVALPERCCRLIQCECIAALCEVHVLEFCEMEFMSDEYVDLSMGERELYESVYPAVVGMLVPGAPVVSVDKSSGDVSVGVVVESDPVFAADDKSRPWVRTVLFSGGYGVSVRRRVSLMSVMLIKKKHHLEAIAMGFEVSATVAMGWVAEFHVDMMSLMWSPSGIA